MSEYGNWQGIPREEIPWHPTVDLEKCIGAKNALIFAATRYMIGMKRRIKQRSQSQIIVWLAAAVV